MSEYLKASEPGTHHVYDNIQLDNLPTRKEGSASASSRNMESINANKLTVKQMMMIIFITGLLVIVAFICGFVAAYLGFSRDDQRPVRCVCSCGKAEESANAATETGGIPTTPTARPPKEEGGERSGSAISTYIRWGRTTCPQNGSSLTYAGVAGGQSHENSGGGSNYICLPLEPEWGNYDDGAHANNWINGAEYEFNPYNPFEGISTKGVTNLQDQTVPCAVWATQRSASIMIPARKVCYDGWTLEYRGYLMSGHYNHPGRTEFVCVDSKPEAHGSGGGNQNGVLFYSVQSHCEHSLPCPPYVQGRELTCVVCSK